MLIRLAPDRQGAQFLQRCGHMKLIVAFYEWVVKDSLDVQSCLVTAICRNMKQHVECLNGVYLEK